MPVRTWKNEFTIKTGVANDQDGTRIVQLQNGDFWVVWQDYSPDAGPEAGADIDGQRYNALGAAQGGLTRLNNNFSANNEFQPSLAQEVGGSGFFMAYAVGFSPPSGAYQNLYVEKKNADGSANGGSSGILPIRIDTANDTSGYNYENPNIAIASATHGLVTYGRVTVNGSAAGGFGQFFNPSTMQLIGGAFAIPTGAAGVEVLSNGNYVLLGSSSGAVFDQTGTQIGSTFYQETWRDLGGGSLAALKGGGFVVATAVDSFIPPPQGQLDFAVKLQLFSSDGTAGASITIDPPFENKWAFAPVITATGDGGFLLHYLAFPSGDSRYVHYAADLTSLGVVEGLFAQSNNRSMLGLADGRVLMVETSDSQEISATIMDVRSTVAPNAFYNPNSRQIGTIFDDVFTTDPAGVAFVNGHDGNDTITEGLGVDGSIAGDDGNDTIILTAADGLEAASDGGAGADKLVLTNLFATTFVDLQAGTLSSNSQNAAATNFENFEYTGALNIQVSGTGAANALTAGSGNDILNGRGGADVMTGGGGDDFYYVDDAADAVVEIAGGGSDRIFASVSYALAGGRQVEKLTTTDNFSTAAINLTGNEVAQAIFGNNGANTLAGGGGQDTLAGLGGDDIYFVDGDDLVYEEAGGGNDRIFASASYTLLAGSEVEKLSTTDNFGTAAINVTGNAFSQSIFGNNGANILIGGGGVDTLAGLGGDDFYYVDGDDLVYEETGGGSDRVFASASFTLLAGSAVEKLTTSDNFATVAINLTGNSFAQSIFGNAGANILTGGGGIDELAGLGGDDLYYVDGDDAVYDAAGGGNDRIFASASHVLLAGAEIEKLTTIDNFATTAINLTGNEFAQALYGNAGANALDGGHGADDLIGLGGADTFRFTTALGGGNVDRIHDLVSGTDKIGLDDAIFLGVNQTSLASGAFVVGAAAQDANDRIIYNQATGALLYDSDGTGANAAIQFATLNAGQTLVVTDFVVI